jgi:fructose-specific phosphotransferase system IIA component
MRICDILPVKHIKAEIAGIDKNQVIEEMIDLLSDEFSVEVIDELKKAVIDREKIMSTGVGKGFAIPHAKTSSIEGIVAAFGKSSKQIDFQSLDGEPVHLVFVLIGKDNLVGPHIKLLSRISRMMNKDEFRTSLLNAKTEEEIYSIFDEEEKKYFELS